ncbi:MAG TPA: maleylpyruvate isomerase family mycothiol-dependent enzyme [Acidimicrobiia bacterium]
MVDPVLLAAIESEGRRLIAAARLDPGRRVPQYPNWTLADLAAHTGSVHALATKVVDTRATERVTRPTLPEGRDALDWADQKLTQLISVFRYADPDVPVWGFGDGSTVAHWVRRMLVETGVHRWDAQHTIGETGPLADLVASTGLDEFSDMWFPLMTDPTTLQVRATDLDRTWTYGDGPPAHTVEGSASDLYLALMTRPSPVTLPEEWAVACATLPPPPDI